jgi:hypothetical protein
MPFALLTAAVNFLHSQHSQPARISARQPARSQFQFPSISSPGLPAGGACGTARPRSMVANNRYDAPRRLANHTQRMAGAQVFQPVPHSAPSRARGLSPGIVRVGSGCNVFGRWISLPSSCYCLPRSGQGSERIRLPCGSSGCHTSGIPDSCGAPRGNDCSGDGRHRA